MCNQTKSKSCLLIMQKKFYSFEKIIKDALISKGFRVEVANDEYPIGITGKILGKLQFPLIHITTCKYITKNFLNNREYDFAIIIKGRGVSKNLIKRMRGSINTIIGYNWDTFNYNSSPSKW